MKRRTFDFFHSHPLFSMILLGTFILFAGALQMDGALAADVSVSFKNGDRISGRLVSVDAQEIQIETSYAGIVKLSSAEVQSWETVDPQIRTRMAAVLPIKEYEEQRSGGLMTTKAPLPAPATQPAEDQAWKRSLSFGFTRARGNADVSDFNGGFSVSRKSPKRLILFKMFGRYGERNGLEVAHLFSQLFRYEWTFWQFPAFNETTVEFDSIKRLNYRVIENAGLSYPVRTGEDFKLSFDFGAGMTREVYTTGFENTLASGLLRLSSTQRLVAKSRLKEQISVFSDLSAAAAYRIHMDLSFLVPLTQHTALKVGALNRYDNQPQRFVKPNDFTLITGINLEF